MREQYTNNYVKVQIIWAGCLVTVAALIGTAAVIAWVMTTDITAKQAVRITEVQVLKK